MDKKLIGIIAAMVALCVIILSWASVFPEAEQSNSAGSLSSAYVDRFFDKNKVIDIYVTLSEADFDDMLQNPAKEEYKQADVVVDGEKVNNVGFRVKGNSSLNMVASSDSDRFSFKLDFDQYIDGQSLKGLTKLNLNNCIQDSSCMREYLSYFLLSEMGVPTPAYCYASIYINNEPSGLYLAVEGIEEPFLERYYGNSYGTLYKPYGERGQGTDLVYTDDNIESYSGLQAVTEVKNGSNEALVNMIKALNEGRDLEKYLNIDEILRYFAVNTVLVNMDSYQGQFTHNYYLYEEDGVFSFLPWDFNLSFGGFGMGGQGSASLNIDQPVSGTTIEARPLIGKLLEVQEYKELYRKYIEEFINGPFALDKMSALIEQTADMIRPYLEEDTTKFFTMEQFEQATAQSSSQASASAEETAAPVEAQSAAAGDRGGNNGRQGGNMALQGGNGMSLIEFVGEQISSVSKQLSGETVSTADTTQPQSDDTAPDRQGKRENGQMPAGNFAPGRQDGQSDMQAPTDGGQQRFPDMAMQNPPDKNGFQGRAPGNVNNMAGNRGMQQSGIPQSVYVVAGAMLLIAAAAFAVSKKRTGYSI